MRTLTSTLAVLGLLAASGCNPCKEACRVESRQFEDCLGAWDMEWVDVGAIDRVDYRRTCVGDVDVWLDGLDTETRAAENQSCQALVDDLRGETDCEAVYQALVDYGAL